MNLDYGPEYEAWRAKVQEFLAEHAQDAPKGEGLRSEKTLAWQRMLIEQGFVARTIPKEYGGGGEEPDILKSRIVAEEFANARVSPGLNSQGITLLVPVLLEVGSEEQKRKFVGPTLRGEVVWCQGYSEPDAGSDLAALRTSAVLDGDQWVVNGQKIWCSTAHEADWIFCLVRTEPDAPKHKGLSFLLFRMDTPGIEVRPLVDMTGGHWFNEVFFTDVRVPKEQMLGVRSEGWQVARSVLGHERDSMGDPRAAFWRLNALIELMKTETVNGQRLIDHPV
jgi:alkylation response protein AidB-like acyl-CoA dehydrogenase